MEGTSRPALPWESPGTWVRLATVVGAYCALAWVGLRFALSDSVASPVWPPAGLAVAAGVLWGRRVLPAVAVGAFLVEVLSGVPWTWSLLMAAGNTAEAAAAAWIMARAGGAAALRRPAGTLQVALAAAVGPLAAATCGTLALVGAGQLPPMGLPEVWATWYLGDVAGIVVLAPVLLLLAQARPSALRRAQAFEIAAAFTVLAIASITVFAVLAYPLTVFVVAPLAWIAIRLGPTVTSLAVLGLDAAAVLSTSNGRGPYADVPPDLAFLLLQAMMVTVSMLALGVAAVANERRRAAGELERRVRERTVLLEQEVRERRKAQAEVAEAQQVAQMGTWRWDVSKPNAEWSTELFRIYGLDPKTHVPSYADYLTRVHPEDIERVKAATDAVFKEQMPYSHDERIRRPDGTWRRLHTWAHAVTDDKGKLVALVGACQDITEREQAAHALTESLERFRLLAESSPIGIVHTTATGAIDYANAAWQAITGVREYRDLAKCTAAVHPDDQPLAAEAWRECLRDGKPFAFDLRWVRADGSVRYTSSKAVPVRDSMGRVTGFVSTLSDITERKSNEQAAQMERETRLEVRRLQELADFKTNFLRIAAHELGTPLTPIKIQLRVLRELVAKRPSVEEGKAIGILDRNVDRLQVLVRDLLESARLQSGRMRLNPRSMDLAHAVHDVVETFQEPAIQTGISLDAKMPNEMAMVGDPDRITQVLYNLLSNAMKFTPTGGRVHVQADDLGETVRFVVEDTGTGFTPEQAARLFQPFTQVHDPTQVNKPGSGLGLYICKGIVEQHGGGLTAFSAGPGKGARFTVILPRVARPPPPAVEIKPREAAAPPTAAPPTNETN